MAVESPTFPGTLQTLRGLGIKVVEIPTDAVTGISLEALQLALEQWPIKAVMLVPSCNNPLGFYMPDARKKALIVLAQQFDIAIIEDDAYGELAYEYPRPRTIKSFDNDGRVLLCSSFSKSLAPGLRMGWIAPGRYLERVLHTKYTSTGYSVTHTQLAVAEFIRQGHYQPHVRRMRTYYKSNLDAFTCWVRRYFPCGICVSRPQGGFLMCIEFPETFDTLRLNSLLRQSGIQIASGSLFSAPGKYRNCMRVHYGLPLTDEMQQMLRVIGEHAEHLLHEDTMRDPRCMSKKGRYRATAPPCIGSEGKTEWNNSFLVDASRYSTSSRYVAKDKQRVHGLAVLSPNSGIIRPFIQRYVDDATTFPNIHPSLSIPVAGRPVRRLPGGDYHGGEIAPIRNDCLHSLPAAFWKMH